MQLLFADQLGPHFDLAGKKLLPIVLSQFGKRRYHRKKAHLILSALLRRAAFSDCEAVFADSYRELLGAATTAVNPTSYPMRRLVSFLKLSVQPARGFVATETQWRSWIADRGAKRLKLEDFYRWQRQRTGLLMDGEAPAGGRWNLDSENRLAARQVKFSIPEPWLPTEDTFDDEARSTLDRLERDGLAEFVGIDGPREFAASRQEAAEALDYFIQQRLNTFGPPEDVMLTDSWTVSHSMLSVPLNLGLLDPAEVARRADSAYRDGCVPLSSAEGFIRQIIGWRDYVWHLYWQFGEDYLESNLLGAGGDLPEAWRNLDAKLIQSNCLAHCIEGLSKHGWLHHIQRLMVLGNVALQRGYSPRMVNDWFVDSFVDGTPWVMPANVIGMTLYADGGRMSTKPYAAGGAYINRMSDYCGSCQFVPTSRLGENACPMTAGYWAFLHRNQSHFERNPRVVQQLRAMNRLADLQDLIQAESSRESI